MSLHIVQLQAENYKRLKAVTITPEGNVVFIGGKNAQGKTSVLDAIWAALAGGEASRATQQPIRDGQDTAVVRLDLGEFIVTRRWTKDDAGTLTVESADGAKYSSPQKMLDDLIGARAFDPLAFTRMSARDQVAALVATVELPFDPSELERERKGVFDSRTEVNREVDKLKGQLAGLTKPNDDTPDVEVSSADIIAEFEKARAHNDAIVRSESLAVRFGNEVDSLTKQIAELTAQLEATAAQFRTTEADRAKLGDPIDTDGISARLAGVEQTNAAIREGQEHHRVTAALSSVKERAAQLTVKLQQIEKRKADALAAVDFPVEHLSFNEDWVTYKGIAFSQASAAEQLRVSVALAMAANPKLRVLRILDGSLLDSDSLKIIAELAVDHDYQIFIEVVSEDAKVGIIMEDGSVKE
ncbi:AAA domain-containing protein [Homoserinimonas aerilata]|uniref:AAA domain-containing protein n=1 Tax=Homoserinimonas aerilata TaxID=1162970 RepID=A0A542YF55_9MICO|nr:AAA family ATPase [Homoserinimonas aerilata]TQL46702.1 AAA domain-containing protein [Homoserinimonas aerilata]